MLSLFWKLFLTMWLSIVGFSAAIGWMNDKLAREQWAEEPANTFARGMFRISQRARAAIEMGDREGLRDELLGIPRMTRSFMLDQLNQEYVLTARVKGVSEGAVIWRHAFRNVLVQLITIIGLTYASLLEGSVLTETVFAWPGIGQYITHSLFNNDMNAVLGGTIVVGVCFVGINMLSDLLYRLVDPRVR